MPICEYVKIHLSSWNFNIGITWKNFYRLSSAIPNQLGKISANAISLIKLLGARTYDKMRSQSKMEEEKSSF